jgi:hypothetical protein
MRIPVALVGLIAALALSACGPATDAEKQLRAALQRTERLPHRFIYSEAYTAEKAPEQKTAVRGLVEDDFRYKARVAVDGRPVLDEAVSDDALFVRFLDPARIGDFLRKPKKRDKGGTGLGSEAPAAPAAPAGARPPGEGPTAAQLLPTRRWVLDPAGAPAVFGSPDDSRLVGDDPVLDALDVFAYVERAIDSAVRIVEFNEESLEYRPKEDPFEHPKKGSKVSRFDFEAPKLPKVADTSRGGNQVTPDIRHFRKLSVYVKGGRVVQILEKIDVESRLDDLAKIYDTKFPTDRPKAEVAAIAVEALNVIRRGQGEDPIRLRTMSYKLADVGGDVKVDVPTDATKAGLALLENRGRPADATLGAEQAAALAATLPGGSGVSPGMGAPASPAPSG